MAGVGIPWAAGVPGGDEPFAAGGGLDVEEGVGHPANIRLRVGVTRAAAFARWLSAGRMRSPPNSCVTWLAAAGDHQRIFVDERADLGLRRRSSDPVRRWLNDHAVLSRRQLPCARPSGNVPLPFTSPLACSQPTLVTSTTSVAGDWR